MRPSSSTTRAIVPLESEPHRRTWMAWPSSREIWGGLLPGIQRDIALVASTVARFEPVVMCANPDDVEHASTMCGRPVEVIGDVPVGDCWMRDSGPIFRIDGDGALSAVGLNFNGWGDRQAHERDARVAEFIAALGDTPFTTAALVAEGGAVDTDGDGTLMATESSVINDNRNPGRSKAELEAALCEAYGADDLIWVPGLRDRDITDDHIDATSRFIRPGVVMVQVPPEARTDVWAEDARQQRQVVSRARDARGRRLEVLGLDGPTTVRSDSPDFLDSYANFYTPNGAVITAEFGDAEADRAAAGVLADAFPGRQVVQLNVDRLHGGGGGIHCVTQQEPVDRP
ncbi:MAG TPA: agmatine deiminase family protein [Actinomycetota bacterium]